MATITGLTADRMLEIEAASVVDGDVVDEHLILTKHDGSTLDAGVVTGSPGPVGPIGSDLEVLVQQAILDIGIPGQIRAGRQLTVDDFTNLGLAAPAGLWNFSNDATDSGGANDLTVKGSVSYGFGIDGVDTTAAQFNGSSALYINDSGTSDPLRIVAGSFGAWFRTAKQGTNQTILSKRGAAAPDIGYRLRITTGNVVGFECSDNGTTVFELTSLSKICDDRWHFVVATYDGILQSLYIDGVLEASALHGASGNDLIHAAAKPFNIGAYNADASTAVSDPTFGRVDEAFATPEILSADKVLNLYCVKLAHTLGTLPSGVSLNVYPGAKGAALVSGDFPSTPLRLYNFSAGSYGNDGSNPSSGLTPTGTPTKVPGPDGTKENAFSLNGSQRITTTDAGLPAGVATCSYGCWFKCSDGASASRYILNWGSGTPGSTDARIYLVNGVLQFATGSGTAVAGPFVADGQWHFVVVVQDASPVDGVKRKFYLDGRMIASSTALGSITLGGANKFVIGSSISSTSNYIGQVDTVFVTNTALLMGEINTLYTKSLYEHLPSPKNAGDHVQQMTDEDLLVVFDTLDIAHQVSLKVMS